MAVEDIEKRVRAMTGKKDIPDDKQQAAFQSAQNELVRINSERQNNLALANAEANADAQVNETLLQAGEMASMGSPAVQQQVESMNPQTQAVLSKYGLGKPRVQRTQGREVKVTPQKVQITNNNITNTTNNVSVPPANVGGPVQGRTLAVKQADPEQARFKTWIQSAFARQNAKAAQREKEYQRREWSLSRSANKMMKYLSDLGSNISEKLNPNRMASTIGGQFRTMLFLFGTMFLAKHWKKVIEIGARIEEFFVGLPGKDGERSRPGFAKMLIGLFGGDPNDSKASIGETIKRFFWNKDRKDGVFNILFDKIENFFKERADAVKQIKVPELDFSSPIKALTQLGEYLGNILKAFVGGADAVRDIIGSNIRQVGSSNSMANKDQEKKRFESAGGLKNTSWGDAAIVASRGENINKLYSDDISSDGSSLTSSSAEIRQTGSISHMINNGEDSTVHVAGVMSGLERLKNTAESKGGVLISEDFISAIKSLGIDTNNLWDNKDLSVRKYKFVKREKTDDDYYKEGADWKRRGVEAFGKRSLINAGKKAVGADGKLGYVLDAAATGDIVQDPAWKSVIEGAKGLVKKGFADKYTLDMVPAESDGKAEELEVEDYDGPSWNVNTRTGKRNKKKIKKKYFEFLEATPSFFEKLRSRFSEKLNNENFSFSTNDEASLSQLENLMTDLKKKQVEELERKYKANNRTGDWKKLKEGIHSDVNIKDSYKAYRDIKRNSEKRDAELDKKIEESPMMKGFEYASSRVKGIYNNIKGYFSNEPLRSPEVISDEEYKNRIIKAMDFAIKELGMTKEQAAGLAGNFMRESGMKTTAKNPGSPATGLAQWLGVRKKAFEHSGEFSEKEISAGWKYYNGPGSGKPLANASFEDQLRFVKWEMENIPAYKRGLEKIKSSKDHQEAAANVFGYYEFSAGPEGAVKNMIENGQDGLGSLNKGINFAGDALLTYNSHKEVDNNKQSTSSNNPEVYTTQNITEPENYVERIPSSANYTTYDWNSSNSSSFPNWNGGSEALAIATKNASSTVTPDSATPTNASYNSYSSYDTPSANTARELVANNDMTEIAKGISGKISTLNENIKVLQTGQLAQAESINNLSAAIGNIQINVNTGGQQKTPVQSATGIPYRFGG